MAQKDIMLNNIKKTLEMMVSVHVFDIPTKKFNIASFSMNLKNKTASRAKS